MTAIEREKRSRSLRLSTRLRPIAFIAALLVLWQIAVSRHPDQLLPGPWAVVRAIGELLQHGLLLKYVVASLFRVTWGFALAAVLAIPLGAHHWLVPARRNGLQPPGSDLSPHLTAGLDSACHSLVRSRRFCRHFSHLPGLFLSLAPDRDECGAKYSRRLYQCRPQFRSESRPNSSTVSCIPPSCRS